MIEFAAAFPTATAADPEAAHVGPVVTVTERPTNPPLPAVNVKTRAFCPLTGVPFVIVQAYVAPPPASGTEAKRPVAFGAAEAGAVMTAGGATPETVIVALPETVPSPTASEKAVSV